MSENPVIKKLLVACREAGRDATPYDVEDINKRIEALAEELTGLKAARTVLFMAMGLDRNGKPKQPQKWELLRKTREYLDHMGPKKPAAILKDIGIEWATEENLIDLTRNGSGIILRKDGALMLKRETVGDG